MTAAERGGMDEEALELIGRLFALATEVLEDAHERSVRGQAPDLDADEIETIAQTIERATGDLRAIAAVIGMLAAAGDNASGARK